MTDSVDTRSVKERLLDAAEVCLAAKGIRATTVLEIAETAGVSRAWLYRHYPDKSTLLGATIVRMGDAFWADAHRTLSTIAEFDAQLAAGVAHGHNAYDAPGALMMTLRMNEPEEFAACAGVGVIGLLPDLTAFWRTYVVTARDRGQIHPDTDIDEASEWIARVLINLTTVHSQNLDPDDRAAVARYCRRYVIPALQVAPAQ
ncbi:TetR/AcrR family transcriptional regulator [Nocardia sp. 348MFTsu5.1]|uniref:TetR/AcrR family transcriptional regulator n=1 Tax=Nocardia sp. 348MFTsu5.1 TaxID=1172185 RepID=UPI000491B107|nr:TetR/AcrR family transcriptional regulator [Nocardia sp. 348MFTsu5.1]